MPWHSFVLIVFLPPKIFEEEALGTDKMSRYLLDHRAKKNRHDEEETAKYIGNWSIVPLGKCPIHPIWIMQDHTVLGKISDLKRF